MIGIFGRTELHSEKEQDWVDYQSHDDRSKWHLHALIESGMSISALIV